MTQITSAKPRGGPHESRQIKAEIRDVLGRFVEAPEVSPIEVLYDMRLPQEDVNLMSLTLENLGFRIEESKVQEIFSGDEHKFSLVTNDVTRRFLLRIPDQILASPSRNNRGALLQVLDLFIENFGESVKLYILHVNTPHVLYPVVLNDLCDQKGISVEFVPVNNYLNDLRQMNDPRVREQVLKQVFSLDVHPLDEVSAKPQVKEISFTEIDKLAKIVASLPNFQDDVTNRRVLVETAGLESVVGDFKYDRTPKTVAWELISKFIQYGVVADQDGLHTFASGTRSQML